MKPLALLSLTIIFISTLAFGEKSKTETTLLECKTESKDYTASFELTETGKAWLRIKTRSKKEYQCSLLIDYYSFQPRAKLPGIELELRRQSCSTNLKNIDDQKIAHRILLRFVGNPETKDLVGSAFWLVSEQPAPCKLTTFEKDELKLNSKLWAEGRWGRQKPNP